MPGGLIAHGLIELTCGMAEVFKGDLGKAVRWMCSCEVIVSRLDG